MYWKSFGARMLDEYTECRKLYSSHLGKLQGLIQHMKIQKYLEVSKILNQHHHIDSTTISTNNIKVPCKITIYKYVTLSHQLNYSYLQRGGLCAATCFARLEFSCVLPPSHWRFTVLRIYPEVSPVLFIIICWFGFTLAPAFLCLYKGCDLHHLPWVLVTCRWMYQQQNWDAAAISDHRNAKCLFGGDGIIIVRCHFMSIMKMV